MYVGLDFVETLESVRAALQSQLEQNEALKVSHPEPMIDSMNWDSIRYRLLASTAMGQECSVYELLSDLNAKDAAEMLVAVNYDLRLDSAISLIAWPDNVPFPGEVLSIPTANNEAKAETNPRPGFKAFVEGKLREEYDQFNGGFEAPAIDHLEATLKLCEEFEGQRPSL